MLLNSWMLSFRGEKLAVGSWQLAVAKAIMLSANL